MVKKIVKAIGSSLLFISTLACGKKGGDDGLSTPPANFLLTATVSTDNSGHVSFTATATNAVSYDFDFGNGVFQLAPSGIVTYRYTASGAYTVNVIAKSAGGQTISKSIQVNVTVAQAVVWSDEFDTPGAPNSAKWGYDLGAGGWGNNELQNYTNRADNAVVSNGTLKIIVKAENYNGSAYTSARLLSKDKFSFKYGKIEARAKIPAGVGTWPAIWMLGNNITTAGWPACGEIDIMEHRGSELNKIFGTVHYTGHSGSGGIGNTTTVANATTDFHIYTVEWSASVIKFFVDNQLFHTVSNSSGLPFNQNFFIILNVAIGGNFGGPVDAAFTSASMEIDYIRVYQ